MINRFQTLDGWRGVSILLVLVGHLFPIGPKSWQLNSAIAGCGMVIFFILSGFLITNLLLKNMNVKSFLIRRFMRIIPLAWLAMIITLTLNASNKELYLPHFLFYANWEPIALTTGTGHLWSLCVEMQFYVLVALLVAVLRSKAFILLPLLCFTETAYRYFSGAKMAINTYYRIDEILAGCILALLFTHSQAAKRIIGKLNPILLFPLLVLSAHPMGGDLNYFRPYIAMLIVGSTLFKEKSSWSSQWLNSRVLIYIAGISYALYVLHAGLSHTWLGQGNTLEKYSKRPLLLAATFLLAHISTHFYEKYWIELGKRWITSKVKTERL